MQACLWRGLILLFATVHVGVVCALACTLQEDHRRFYRSRSPDFLSSAFTPSSLDLSQSRTVHRNSAAAPETHEVIASQQFPNTVAEFLDTLLANIVGEYTDFAGQSGSDVKALRPNWPRGKNVGLGLGLHKLASASNIGFGLASVLLTLPRIM